MSIWNLSDGTNASKNEDPQRGWLYEQVALAITNGYRPIPVIEKSGDIIPLVEYATHPDLTADDPLWAKCSPNVFSIILDDCVLVDDDSHKVDNVEQVEVDARPFQFFDGVTPRSFHWLFTRPEGDVKQSYRAPDGAYDLKTGNQLAHVKKVKTQQWWPKSDLETAPQWILDLLKPAQATVRPEMTFDVNPSEKPTVETLVDALSHIYPPASHDEWNAIIAAIHHSTDGSETGLDIAHQWSQQDADNYDPRLIQRKWKSYRDKAVSNTFGTIAKFAKDKGWLPPKEKVDITELTQTPANPIDVSDVDIMNPPSEIANCILQEMTSREYRSQDEAKLAGLIQTLKNTVPNRLDANGSKVNIVTLVIAQSAAGKEMPQEYCTEIMERVGLISRVSTSPRSDKDLIQTILDNRGHTLFNIDEGHRFFNTVSDKSSSYAQNIIPELLSLTSTARYTFNAKLRRELLEGNHGLYAKRELLENRLLKGSEDGEEDSLAGTEYQLKEVEWMINTLEHGLKNPIVSLALSSTPVHMDNAIEATSLENGFMGRAFVFRSVDGRAKLNRHVRPKDFGVAELIRSASTQLRPCYCSEALGFLDEIYEWYEDDKHRNHPVLGALYARAVPRIEGLASLVALGEDCINTHHLRWAMAVFERNIDSVKQILVERALGDDKDNEAALYELIRGRVNKFVSKLVHKSQVFQKVFKVKQLDSSDEKQVAMFDEIWSLRG